METVSQDTARADRSRRRSRLAVLVGAALALAGCADDDGAVPVASGTGSASPQRTSAQPSSATTVPPTTTATETDDVDDVTIDDVTIDEGALQAILDDWRAEVGTFGATLSIRVPGQEDVLLASGIDDRDLTVTLPDGSTVEHTETPMPTGGTHPMGYVARTFVAAAALQLVDEGRLTMDEPVAPWLPELPGGDRITLRMLLGYTSGLGQLDDAAQASMLLADLSRAYSPEEVLAGHTAQPAVGPPGGDPAFGRSGYIAAGILIERVLGQDLAAVIDERFLVPLGLDDTYFSDGTTVATRHGWFGLPSSGADRGTDYLDVPQQAAMTSRWASEAMISSTADVLDWAEALFSGEVLGVATTATMLQMNPVSPPPVPNRYFGLGVTGYCIEAGCDPNDAELVGAPGGGFCCWSTQLVYHRESGVVVFVHANTNDPLPASMIELPIEVLAALDLV